MSREAMIKKLNEIERAKIAINKDALKTGKLSPVFREMYALPTNFTCFEAGFLRAISWLYMLYYEAGKGELDFAIEKFNVYPAKNVGAEKKHFQELKTLRTIFQHSFDLEIARNAQQKTIAEDWFFRAIKKKEPATPNDWQICLELIISDALLFLHGVHYVIQRISNDEFSKSIVDDWNFKSSRILQQHDFDSLIWTVAHEFGIDYLDIVKFRKQNADIWIQELQNLTGNFDFKIQARKLIERDMIKKPVSPITGDELMEIFNIPRGPKVKMLAEKALNIFIQNPCSKDELINRLKEQMKTNIF